MAFTLEFHSVWAAKAKQLILLCYNNQFNWLILSNRSSILLSFTLYHCMGILGFIERERTMSFPKPCLRWMIYLWPKLFFKISYKQLNSTHLHNKEVNSMCQYILSTGVNGLHQFNKVQIWRSVSFIFQTKNLRCRKLEQSKRSRFKCETTVSLTLKSGFPVCY